MDEQRAWIKLRRKKRLRVMAALLSICLLVTNYPDILGTLSALAEGTREGTVYVTGFEDLPEEVREQTVPLGTGIEELTLPDSLEAVVAVEEAAPEDKDENPDGEENPDSPDHKEEEETGDDADSTDDENTGNENTGTDTEETEGGTGNTGDENNGVEGGTETEENGGADNGQTEESPADQNIPEVTEETLQEEPAPEAAEEAPEGQAIEEPAQQESTGTDVSAADSGSAEARREEPAALSRETHTVTLPIYAAENELDIETLENSAEQTAERTESATIEGVTWQSDPSYDGDREGTYRFRALLPEGYAPAEGVSLPEISVTVQGEDPALEQALTEGQEPPFPTTEEELEAYLAYLQEHDPEEAARTEPLQASNLRAHADFFMAQGRTVDSGLFEERHKARVVWINDKDKPVAKTALKSHCSDSYLCLSVPGAPGTEAQVHRFYFTKDILRDTTEKETVLGEFTLPRGYVDGGDLFATKIGMYNAVSMLCGLPRGDILLQIYDYVDQKWYTYYSLSLRSGGAVLGGILSKEEWLPLEEQPDMSLGYALPEGDTSVKFATDREVTKRFGVSFADSFGVSVPGQEGDWEIRWALKTMTDGREEDFPAEYNIRITESDNTGFTLTAGPEAGAVYQDGVALYAKATAVYRGKEAGSVLLLIGTDGAGAGYYINYADASGSFFHTDTKIYGRDYTIKAPAELLAENDPGRDLFDELFAGSYTGTDGNTYRPGDIYKKNASLGLFPDWKARTCQVTLEARCDQNGEYPAYLQGNGSQDITMTFGERYTDSVPVPKTAPEGYVFLGFYEKEDGKWGDCYFDGAGRPYGACSSDRDITLYARWRLARVTYYLDVNASGLYAGCAYGSFWIDNPKPGLTLKDYDITLPETEEEVWNRGHRFLGWYTQKEGGTWLTQDAVLPAEESFYTLYARWQAKQYNMTYDANGGSFAPGAATRAYVTYKTPYGTAVTTNAPVPTKEGYVFAGWGTYPKARTPIKETDTVTATEDFTLYALWRADQVTVNLDPGEGKLPAGEPSCVVSKGGKPVSLPVPTREGYHFLYWEGEDAQSAPAGVNRHTYTVPLSVESAVTLQAVWEINSYDVTFNKNGGSGAQMAALHLTYRQGGVLPACTYTRTGYAFDGWNTKADGSGTAYAAGAAVTDLTDQGTFSLYATWKPLSCTVSFDPNGGALPANKESMDVSYGQTYGTLPAPVRDRYTFLGWYTAKTGGTQIKENTTVTKITEHTLYAHWEYGFWKLSFDLRGGLAGTVETFAQREVEKNKSYTLPTAEPLWDGWDFGGWSDAQDQTAEHRPGDSITCNQEEMTLYAVWTSKDPFVSYDDGVPDAAATEVSNMPASQKINVTTGSVTLSPNEPLRTGYTFQGWALKEDGEACYHPGETVKTTLSLTLYAVWQEGNPPETVTLTLKDDNTTLSEAYYPKGTQVTLPEGKAKTGVIFTGWSTSSGGTVSNNAGEKLTLNSNTTRYAVYKDVECKWRADGSSTWSFGTLEQADAALTGGGEVVMLKDKSQEFLINLSGSYTLDLNGKTITGVEIAGSGPLTICNGTLKYAKFASNDDHTLCLRAMRNDNSVVTLRDVTVKCWNGWAIVFSGKELTLTGNTFLEGRQMPSGCTLIQHIYGKITIEYAEVACDGIMFPPVSIGNFTIKDGFFYNTSKSIECTFVTIEGGYFASKKLPNLVDGKYIYGPSDEYILYDRSTEGELEGEEAVGVSPINKLGNTGKWYKLKGTSTPARDIWNVNGVLKKETMPSYTQDGENTFELLFDGIECDDVVTWAAEGRYAVVDLGGHTYKVKGGYLWSPNTLTMRGDTAEGGSNSSIGNGTLYMTSAGIAKFDKTAIGADLTVKAGTVILDSATDTIEAGARFYARNEITNLWYKDASGKDVKLVEQSASDDINYHYYIATPWDAAGGDVTASADFHSNYPAGSSLSAASKSETQTRGQKWALPAAFTAPTGFTFYEWNTKADGSGQRITAETLYDSAVKNVYAVWKRTNATVTFNANGGKFADGAGMMTRTVPYNNAVGALPAVKREGYTFDGWYTAASGGSAVSAAAIITVDKTYYAHWTKASGTKYTVHYMCGSTKLDEREFYGTTGAALNTTAAINAVKKTFTGYTYAGRSSDSDTEIKADGSSVVTLKYNQITSKVSVSVVELTGTGSTETSLNFPSLITIATSPSAGTAFTSGNTISLTNCPYGTSVTLKAAAKTGYEFAGWAGDYTGTNQTLTFPMPGKAVEVRARYRKKAYAVTYSLEHLTAHGQNGTGAAPASAAHGTDVSVTLKAPDGYTLPDAVAVTMAGKTLSTGTGAGKYTYTVSADKKSAALTVKGVTGNVAVTAKAVANTYSVQFRETIQAGETGGRISAPNLPASVSHGNSLSVTLAVKDGYELPDTIEIKRGVDADGNGGMVLAEGTYNYNHLTGSVYIPSVSGNILISAGAGLSKNTPYQAAYYRMGTDGAYDEDTPYETYSYSGETGAAVDAAALKKEYGGFTYEKCEWNTSAGEGGSVDSGASPSIAADGSTVVKFYYSRNQYTLTVKAPDGQDGWTDWTGEGGSGTYYYRQEAAPSLPARTGYDITGWKAYGKESWEQAQTGGTAPTPLYSGRSSRVSFLMPAKDVVVIPAYAPKSLRVSRAGLIHVEFDTTGGEPKARYKQTEDFSAVIQAQEGYTLPEEITIVIGEDPESGETLAPGDFTYDKATGTVTITNTEKLTGDIEIRAAGVRRTPRVFLGYAEGVTQENAHFTASREIGTAPYPAHSVDYNGRFALVLTPQEGYVLPEESAIQIKTGVNADGSGGTEVTEGVSYNRATGALSVGGIKEDIHILLPAAEEGEPLPVPYTVEHYRQDGQDSYRLTARLYSEEKPGTEITAEKREAMKKAYTGYTYNAEKSGGGDNVEIAADGSTVIRLYYDYTEYTLTVEMGPHLKATVGGQEIQGSTADPALSDTSFTYTYHYGEAVDLTLTDVAAGKSFLGWYGWYGGDGRLTDKDEAGAKQAQITSGYRYAFTMPAQDVTVSAKSGTGKYELTAFGAHGTAAIDGEQETGYLADIPYDTEKTVTLTPEAHFSLPDEVAVEVGGEKAPAGAYTYTKESGVGKVTLTVTDDTAVIFEMTGDPSTVTFDYQGATGGNSVTEKELFFGDPYGELPQPVKTGYAFLGWSLTQGDSSSLVDSETEVTQDDHTLYACWQDNAPPDAPVLQDGVTLPAGWTNAQNVIPLKLHDNVAVTELWVSLDGAAYSQVTGFTGGEAYDYPVLEGEHTYQFTAKDGEGNTSAESKAFSVKLDTANPVLGTLTYENKVTNLWNWIIGKRSMVIHVPVTDTDSNNDAGSGVTQISYTMTPADAEGNTDSSKAVTETAAVKEGEARITFPEDFRGTIAITCKDNAGNAASGVTVENKGVLVEDHAPAVTSNLQAGYYDAAPQVQITVKDDKDNAITAGLASVTYQVGNNAEETAAIAANTLQTEVSITIADSRFSGGVTAIRVKARDNAGNETEETLFVRVKGPERTPDARISYPGEKLTGLVPGEAYTIDGEPFRADGEGMIPIKESWFNTTLSIVKKGNGQETTDSPAQSLPIPARPATPAPTGTDESGPNKKDGKLNGLQADTLYEISTDGGKTWEDKRADGNGGITGLSPDTYKVRVKATDSSFASLPSGPVTIGAYKIKVIFMVNNTVYQTVTTHYGESLTGNQIPAVPPKADAGDALYVGEWCDPSGNPAAFTDIRDDMTVHAVYTKGYTVTLVEGEGYTLSAVSGSTSPVKEGTDFTFRLAIDGAYRKTDSFAVKVNGIAVELSADGTYTIKDIRENQTVTAEGLEKKPSSGGSDKDKDDNKEEDNNPPTGDNPPTDNTPSGGTGKPGDPGKDPDQDNKPGDTDSPGNGPEPARTGKKTGNLTETANPTTRLEVGEGAVIVTVVCEEKTYTAGVKDTVAVANAVLTQEQIELVNGGETIEIRIDVKDITDSILLSDQEIIEEGIEECRKEMPGLTLGMYIDISMFIKIGGGDWNTITHTREPVEVVVGIPETLKAEGREFTIIRSHDGAYTLLPDLDDDPDTITISTDLFSAYAIAYEQTDQTAEKAKCGLCHICPTFLGICYFIWLALIIVLLLIIWLVMRRKKEEEEEKKETQHFSD